MIPYQIDPSLHNGEPAPPLLHDGFSPPAPSEQPGEGTPAAAAPAPAQEGGSS